MPKIEIVSIKPKATKGEQVVVDVEAALYQERDGEPDGGIRIPNITFEVRTSVANATGISSAKGYFKKANILIDVCEGDEQTATTQQLTIIANCTLQDESTKVIEEVSVDISEQLATIYQAKRTRKGKDEVERQRKATEDERIRLKQEMYEKLAPERKRQIKADITKAGEDIKTRERLEVSPFNVLREHEDHPHAERTAIMVAAEAADRTIGSVEIYKLARWAGDIMKIATEKQPLLSIKIIEKYKDRPWAPEVLRIAAQRHPHEVVKALSQYGEYDWCKDVIMHIAETEPQAAFEEVEMWEFYEWAEEAAMVAAKKAPEFTINNFQLYQDQPWAQRVYESVAISGRFTNAEKAELQRLLKKKIDEAGKEIAGENPTNAEKFAILYEHRFHPHSEVMMKEVAKHKPSVCIQAVRIFKSAKWAKEIMLLATEKAPIDAIDQIDGYIEMEWAEDVMKKAASLKPKEAIQALPKYAGYTWSRSIVESIASSPASCINIFKEMEFIEYQPWAQSVVENAAINNPEKALALQSGYQNQPWAGDIVRGIEDRKALAVQQEQNQLLAQKALAVQQERERKQLMAYEKDVELERQLEQQRLLADQKAQEAQQARKQQNESGSSHQGKTIREILGITRGKVATLVLTLTLGAGAIYYTNKESTKSTEQTQHSSIITFNSKKEALEKGYLVIKDGIEYPKEGYEWAYSEKENAKFPKGDPRRYAVRKK